MLSIWASMKLNTFFLSSPNFDKELPLTYAFSLLTDCKNIFSWNICSTTCEKVSSQSVFEIMLFKFFLVGSGEHFGHYLILNTIYVIFFVDTYYMCGINSLTLIFNSVLIGKPLTVSFLIFVII